jgi:hypothetical protein
MPAATQTPAPNDPAAANPSAVYPAKAGSTAQGSVAATAADVRPPSPQSTHAAQTAAPEPGTSFVFLTGSGVISKYSGNAGAVTVPAQIGGVPVLHIGSYAFMHSSAEQVTIEPGVQSIGWWSFANCGNLKRIVIPASVTSIDRDAFYRTTGFTIATPAGSAAHAFALQQGIAAELI